MTPIFLYRYADGAPFEATAPVSYVTMGQLGLTAVDGPGGTFALRGRGFDGSFTDLGVMESDFIDAVETMVIHGVTSDAPYNDFDIELRVIG